MLTKNTVRQKSISQQAWAYLCVMFYSYISWGGNSTHCVSLRPPAAEVAFTAPSQISYLCFRHSKILSMIFNFFGFTSLRFFNPSSLLAYVASNHSKKGFYGLLQKLVDNGLFWI